MQFSATCSSFHIQKKLSFGSISNINSNTKLKLKENLVSDMTWESLWVKDTLIHVITETPVRMDILLESWRGI